MSCIYYTCITDNCDTILRMDSSSEVHYGSTSSPKQGFMAVLGLLFLLRRFTHVLDLASEISRDRAARGVP